MEWLECIIFAVGLVEEMGYTAEDAAKEAVCHWPKLNTTAMINLVASRVAYLTSESMAA